MVENDEDKEFLNDQDDPNAHMAKSVDPDYNPPSKQ